MKKWISFTFLVLLTLNVIGQKPLLTKEEYLKKSRNQSTTAWLLLGGGIAFSLTGMIIGLSEVRHQVASVFTGEEPDNSNAGGIFFYSGLISMGGSIPFFIMSSKNSKRASSLKASLKLEKRDWVRSATISQKSYPALAVRVHFGGN